MKTFGYICIILGAVSLLGVIIAWLSPVGPLFWISLGIALVVIKNQKEKDNDSKDKWSNDSNSNSK